MALSQLQCLDDNHVNPRTHESKPEFLYCEDQRLALEALLQDGREAFFKYLETRGLRGFLSDPELETLTGAVEPYDPGTELYPENAEVDEPPLSLHYWPELSDTSIPHMDLGWPDGDSYRGVTRTTMYSQPPLEGQTHIKEIVRKMIAQAQRVIAVVMDVFTDVDIFRDLLDAGFKRRVSVYILLEHTSLPHFLSMCQRANMHAGHLKHLRVRCIEGVEFHTRSSTKVRGRMGHRFMFIDGDKAVSGSYSFTWTSSRLERNLITVVTGQAVDGFDRLFRILYGTSSSVDLRQVATEPEPEPEPLPQAAAVAPPSAAIARKLYSPKYALALGNPSPSPAPSAENSNSNKTKSQENCKTPEGPDTKKGRRRRASKEAIQEAPPIHPGLVDLEKACLMSYLPTWPEPDPSSDVIGFINIRDSNKPNQVHLQRSEMFGTSQAIKFSSPFNRPKETLPEVAKPRQLMQMSKLKPAQDKTKAEESVVDRAQSTQLNAQPGESKSNAEAPEQNSPAPECESEKDITKTLNTEDKLQSNTPSNQETSHNTTPHLNAHAPPRSSSKVQTPNTSTPSHSTQGVTANNPKPDSLPGSKAKEAETSLSAQTLDPRGPTDSNTGGHTQTKTVLPHTDSHTQAVHTQPQNSSEMTPNVQTPTANRHGSPSSTSAMSSQPASSTSLSENHHVSITTSTPTSASAPLSSISPSSSLPPVTSSSTTPNPALPSSSKSSSLTSAPPVPKPRTIQLVIKDGVTSDGQKLPEFSVARRPETSTDALVVPSEPAVATVAQTSPEKEPELQNNSGSKTGAQKDAENTGNIGEAPQQKQSGTSQETKNEEAVGLHDDKAGMQLVTGTNLEAQSDVLITDASKAESVNIQEIIQKDVEPKTLTSLDCKLTPQIDCVAAAQAGTKGPERAPTGCKFPEVPNENRKNVTQGRMYRATPHELQRISYCESTPHDIGAVDAVESLKAPTHTVSATHNPHMSKDSAGDSTHTSVVDTLGQQGNPSFTPEHCTDAMPDTTKHNTHSTLQELIPKARGNTHTPEKPLHLDLRSATPERESRFLAALARTPTPDGFIPRMPTPDSQTHTPDPRSYTPDFRTPTPDVSDGYVSPRTDSALSTTSEEYYECSDSPLHEPVFDRAAYRNHGTTEDHGSFTHTNTPNATSVATSPAYINYNTAATLGTTDQNTSSSETQSLSGPASDSSSSSSLEKKLKRGEEETVNEENGREADEKGRKVSVGERRTEGDLRGTQRRASEEAKRTADHFNQSKDSTETVETSKEAQPQAPKRKRVLNQSAAERLVDGGVTPGELTSEGAEPKRLSTGDLKPKTVSSEGERPALGPSSVERSDRPQLTKDTEGQKLLQTPPRPPRDQPSRPLRSPSASQHFGPRPWVSHQLKQAENKALNSSFQVLDNGSSPRRPPARPPPPAGAGAVGSAAGQKQAEVLHSQRSLLSRQSLAVQGRAGQSPNQHSYPKPQASFLHTHPNIQSQLHPDSHNQTVSAQEACCQEEGRAPFSFTFSRLYSLKGLKDKMSKLPVQSRRASTSSPVHGRKSTG
ncbi:flocculation protein FLO11-like [Morone saxatilis]|uniref:flocculation protein FLO11-like n=1 Tax=Morone saxatilis TaxID=34816 RepID=UPI0015E1E9B9|nr:flocculation protein FLO11-like [Morone saxatilis]